ncbi:MAG: RNase adapter protein RapZ [Chloroflexota bacterium]|jgi:UPF0042 nucleotide-binding protein|nr:RNase adapter protein RapZ [Chloroflexota bacterium]
MAPGRLVLVAGLSGSGRSQAVRALEMMGYTCTDNLPPRLLAAFVEEPSTTGGPRAAVLDARGLDRDGLAGLVGQVRALDAQVIYLEAETDTLVRRFSETRKTHPLDTGAGLRGAVEEERGRLGELREVAEVVDTTDMRVDELVSRVQELVAGEAGAPRVGASLPVNLVTFGYKYGVPTEADWVIDSRFLENPFYVPALRDLTGRDAAIRDFVLGSPLTGPFLDGVAAVLEPLLEGYREWGKPALFVAVGCTGGRHRSVVLAEEIARRLEASGVAATVRHRDLDR